MVNWRKVFGRSSDQPSSDPDVFREFALRALSDRFHGAEFVAADQPLVINFGTHVFGLQSVHATYQRDQLSAGELRDLVITHFERMLADSAEKDSPAPPLWSEAAARLRPQIMPIEYIEQAPASLLSWSLNEDVAIGLVIDQEHTYAYVRDADPPIWGQSAADGRGRAIRNLYD